MYGDSLNVYYIPIYICGASNTIEPDLFRTYTCHLGQCPDFRGVLKTDQFFK